jgi:hypothetical protein
MLTKIREDCFVDLDQISAVDIMENDASTKFTVTIGFKENWNSYLFEFDSEKEAKDFANDKFYMLGVQFDD